MDDNETGWKDTVRMNPGEMVSIAAKFDGLAGRYMYHFHILEHEDHEMMRPFVVMPGEVMQYMMDMRMLDGGSNMNMAGMSAMGRSAGASGDSSAGPGSPMPPMGDH